MSKKFEGDVKKILVALDGSAHSNKALDLAVDMAKKWKAKIYLIHVFEKRNVPEEFAQFAKTERLAASDYFEKTCAMIVGDAEAKVKKAGIKDVETICPTGHPADEIIKAAKRYQIDQIIMGSRGLGGFSGAVMGSVSTKVCNFADTTCVTVK